MTVWHISCFRDFSITVEIPWNSGTILSRYEKPVKANGHVGTNLVSVITDLILHDK